MPVRTLPDDAGNVTRNPTGKCAHWSSDAAIHHSAYAYQRAAGTGKAVAAANGGLHVSRGTAARRGDPYSLLARAFRPLAESEHTTAWSAISEARILVMRGELSDRTPAELRGRLLQIGYEHIRLSSELMRLIYEEGVTAARRAVHAELADLNEEAAAVCDEIAERAK
jgi:hypothetical protein